MKVGPFLFRITGAVLGLELLLGGLLTFGFISSTSHIVVGFIAFFLAIALMIVSLVSKPKFRPMQMLSTVLVVLIVVQISKRYVSDILQIAHLLEC